MSDDLPTTQELLLDHLRRIVEGFSCVEDGGKKIWIFGTGNDALISLYSSSQKPSLEGETKNKERTSDAEEQLFWSSISLAARDCIGVPIWLEFRRKMRPKALRELAEGLTKAGNRGTEEAYAFEMVSKLRDLVDRAQKAVPEVHLLPKVPRSVDNYLSEAAFCFRYGFDLACISLCRCALEEALKDRISTSCGHAVIRQTNLDKLIDTAAGNRLKILDSKLQAKAHEIRREGNNCAHGNLSKEQATRTAFRVVKDCREIVQHLYNER